MMARNTKGKLAVVISMAVGGTAWALIPEPDVIHYGTLTIDGVLIQGTGGPTNVSVFAELSNTGEELVRYTIGEDQELGDNYVLRIPLDAVDPRTEGKARVGESVELKVQVGSGTPESAGTFVITERGEVTNADICLGQGCPGTFPADCDGDGDVDGVDFSVFASCFNKAGNPPRTFGCTPAQGAKLDFDDDGDVDGVDFSSFASCFNKAGNPPRTLGCPQL